jgi:hypothetical protein
VRIPGLLQLVSLASLTVGSHAQLGEVRAPSDAVAGVAASITTTGSGSATFYLVGPGVSLKRDVKLGGEVQLDAKSLENAGRYLGIVCADTCQSAAFFVSPAKPVSLTFLVHPSRAPVGQSDVISGVALPFDEFRNLVIAPSKIVFESTAAGKTLMSDTATTQSGVAWFRSNSGKSAEALQVIASLNNASVRRVVQQVASEPCSLRIKARPEAKGIALETEPVRDCSGNPVPDGTIVTFTARDGEETDTVDAPVKKGVARAEIAAHGAVAISAACGVVMGNELRVGARE